MLGLGSNSRLLGKGSKDTLALKAQIIVLERAGTPKKGLILCLPEPSGPCGGRGWGGGATGHFNCPLNKTGPFCSVSAVGTLEKRFHYKNEY